DLMLPDDKDPKKKGTSVFLRQRVRDLDKLTNDVSVLFFGVNISCAQCHDHPLVTDWHQDHFFGLKSFFAGTFEAGGTLAERDAAPVPFKTPKGVSRQAKFMFLTGKVVEPPPGLALEPPGKKGAAKAPKGKAPAAPAGPPKFSARTTLVELALEEGQRDFFAKAIVNRVWHRLHGH